ncbi:MAG: hypothetical protein ABIN80_12450 [Dyadobacter sp.]|uniref:hypothetical protein n=1 Tax=Dyadobacter sp. TaxID=1914288 RepID=UPI003266B8E7
MTQLLQNIYLLAPYIFSLVLIGATGSGIWLILQLRKPGNSQHFSVGDTLFIKRNAERLRKMQLH